MVAAINPGETAGIGRTGGHEQGGGQSEGELERIGGECGTHLIFLPNQLVGFAPPELPDDTEKHVGAAARYELCHFCIRDVSFTNGSLAALYEGSFWLASEWERSSCSGNQISRPPVPVRESKDSP